VDFQPTAIVNEVQPSGGSVSGIWCRSIQRTQGIGCLVLVSLSSAMAGHVHSKFQPTPDSKFVKCATQMILDYLFTGADDLADFAIGQTLPDQNRDLIFLSGETLARCHDRSFVFVSVASQLHAFDPIADSRTRKQRAEVVFYSSPTEYSWRPISLLLKPCTSKSRTC
jgi:hypothetical protein